MLRASIARASATHTCSGGGSNVSVVATSLSVASSSNNSPATTPPFTFTASPQSALPSSSSQPVSSFLLEQKRGILSSSSAMTATTSCAASASAANTNNKVSFSQKTTSACLARNNAHQPCQVHQPIWPPLPTSAPQKLKEGARIRLDSEEAYCGEDDNSEGKEKAEAIARKNLSNLTSFTPFAAPKPSADLRPISCDGYLQTVPLFTIPIPITSPYSPSAASSFSQKKQQPQQQKEELLLLACSVQLPYTAKVTDRPTSVDLVISGAVLGNHDKTVTMMSGNGNKATTSSSLSSTVGPQSDKKHSRQLAQFKASLPLEVLLDNDALTFDSNVQRHSIVSPTLIEGMQFGIRSISEVIIPDGPLSLAERFKQAIIAKKDKAAPSKTNTNTNSSTNLGGAAPSLNNRYIHVTWESGHGAAQQEQQRGVSHQPTHSPYAILADLPGIDDSAISISDISSDDTKNTTAATTNNNNNNNKSVRHSAIPLSAFENISRTIADSVADAATNAESAISEKVTDFCFDAHGDAYIGQGGTLSPHFYRNMRVIPKYANVIPAESIGRAQRSEEEDAAARQRKSAMMHGSVAEAEKKKGVNLEDERLAQSVEVTVVDSSSSRPLHHALLPSPLLSLPRLAPVDKIYWDHAMIFEHPPSSSLCACFDDGCTRAVKNIDLTSASTSSSSSSSSAKEGSKNGMNQSVTHEALRRHMRKKETPPMATVVTNSKDEAKFAADCRKLILTIENFGFGVLEDPESLGGFPTPINPETGKPAPLIYEPPSSPAHAQAQSSVSSNANHPQQRPPIINSNTRLVDYRAQQAESLITRVFGYVRNCHYGLFSTWSNGHVWKHEDLSGDAQLMEKIDECNAKRGFKTNHLQVSNAASAKKKKHGSSGSSSTGKRSGSGNTTLQEEGEDDLKVLNKAGSDPHADGAYSGVHLDLHTDNTYFLDVPRLQAFGCIFTHSAKTTGGESCLVDGARVVLEMARLCASSSSTTSSSSVSGERPTSTSLSSPPSATIATRRITERYTVQQRRRFLELLCTVPIAGRFEKEGHFYNGLRPVISLSKGATVDLLIDLAREMPLSTRADGKVNGDYIDWCRRMQHALGSSRPLFDCISFNNSDRAPLNPFVSKAFQKKGGPEGESVDLLDVDKVREYYRAYEWFHSFVHDPELAIHFTLRPGQMLFFDNRRVLHGRLEFSGPRVMCGSYVANDEYFSSLKAACHQLNREEMMPSAAKL